MVSLVQDRVYTEKDAVFLGLKSTMISGSVGLMVSALQNALSKDSYGMKGILTRTGGTIATFATTGGLFSFSEALASNLRKKEDPLNAFIGGLVAGSAGGIRIRSLSATIGYGLGLGCLLGLFDWCGGTLKGIYRDFYSEESKRMRETLFKTEYRRPRSEIVEAIGSGRGI